MSRRKGEVSGIKRSDGPAGRRRVRYNTAGSPEARRPPRPHVQFNHFMLRTISSSSGLYYIGLRYGLKGEQSVCYLGLRYVGLLTQLLNNFYRPT